MEKRKVGRPLNFKLSQESKNKIAKSHTGLKHSEATKNKIAESVRLYHAGRKNGEINGLKYKVYEGQSEEAIRQLVLDMDEDEIRYFEEKACHNCDHFEMCLDWGCPRCHYICECVDMDGCCDAFVRCDVE